jgi:hypothetical protein
MEDKSALEARLPMGEGNSKLFRYNEPDIGKFLPSDRSHPIEWAFFSNWQSGFTRGHNAPSGLIQEAN